MTNKRFLIASGGTGGHFYPGFALGKFLHEHGSQVLFVVRRNDPAADVLAEHHLPCAQLDLQMGLPRSVNPMRHIRFIKQLLKSFSQTRQLIGEFKPDVTLGMGGYVSFPLIFCSHRMKVKTVVHESNTVWGLANKICARFATLRLLGLPMGDLPARTVLVSTPIRPEFGQAVRREEVFSQLGLKSSVPTVLVMGGSQGAKGLNEALPALIRNNPSWQFIHLTGKRWYETQLKAYQGLSNVKTLAYCEEVYKLIQSADMMIARSGASTLAEMIACQVPAILVPFPHAAANHQYFNAKVLADASCAQIVCEGEDFSARLMQTFETFIPEKLAAMRQAYEGLAIPSPLHATQQIAQLLVDL